MQRKLTQPNPGQRGRRNRRQAGAFTLIEVLLVLVILVVIGSIAASQFMGAGDQAREDAAKTQVGMFNDAIEMYKFQVRQLPESLEDLLKAPSDKTQAERWRGPYLTKKEIPLDPWDQEYKFSAQGKQNENGYDVWSIGPDGDDGSDDDIGNW